MNLSKNLSVAEFTKSNTATRKGLDNSLPKAYWLSAKALAENIFQPLRDRFGTPLYITSGFRSKALNEAIGGSNKSQHSKGEAIDIDMDGRKGPDNAEVFNYIKECLPFDQLIWEFGDDTKPSWVHVSYNPDGEQRGEILVAYKDNGRTKYKYW